MEKNDFFGKKKCVLARFYAKKQIFFVILRTNYEKNKDYISIIS